MQADEAPDSLHLRNVPRSRIQCEHGLPYGHLGQSMQRQALI